MQTGGADIKVIGVLSLQPISLMAGLNFIRVKEKKLGLYSYGTIAGILIFSLKTKFSVHSISLGLAQSLAAVKGLDKISDYHLCSSPPLHHGPVNNTRHRQP